MRKIGNPATIEAITRAVRLSSRHAWLVISGFLLLAIVAASFLASHFAITTDSKELLSSSLPWRQQEIMLDKAFPQSTNQIIAVVDATTPEAADEAADALVNDLSPRSDVIRSIRRPDGGEFFARNGVLFLSVDEVRRDTAELITAQPFLGTLAADPTLRGVLRTLSQSIEGVRRGKAELEDLRPAVVAIADALERLAKGDNPAFSWRRLITGRAPKPSELRRFVDIQPVLDFDDLEPGGKATAAIREAISRLDLTAERGVKVRLTGSVALADEEFATVADGAGLNGAVTLLVVILVLWLALKQARIILAVLVSLVIGLMLTAAIGLWMVGALNLISVAFAVLFVGLGVDFGIQFSVRYRAERHASPDFEPALLATAGKVAGPLLLAAASIAAAFYSFLPTAYVGLSELGLIAGTGHVRRVRDHRDPASRAAHRAQAGRRAGSDRICGACAARPLSRKAAQLGGRNDAGGRDSWPALARELAVRLQSARSARSGFRIGRDACSTSCAIRTRARTRSTCLKATSPTPRPWPRGSSACRRSIGRRRCKASFPRIRTRSWRSSTTRASSWRTRLIRIEVDACTDAGRDGGGDRDDRP